MKKIFAIAILLMTIFLIPSCSKDENLSGENASGDELSQEEMLIGTWTVNVAKSKVHGKTYESLGMRFFQITFFDNDTIQERYTWYGDTITWTDTYVFTGDQILHGDHEYEIRRFDKRNLVMFDSNIESYIVSFRRDR